MYVQGTAWSNVYTALSDLFLLIHTNAFIYVGHGLVDLTAFNTDGFDVSGKELNCCNHSQTLDHLGRNVWIHDVAIWNQDDCIAVKVLSFSVFKIIFCLTE